MKYILLPNFIIQYISSISYEVGKFYVFFSSRNCEEHPHVMITIVSVEY